MPGQITLTEARRRSLHTEAFYTCMVSILHEHERAMQVRLADHKQVDAAGGWLPALGGSPRPSGRGAVARLPSGWPYIEAQLPRAGSVL